jgi:hypothetical protein
MTRHAARHLQLAGTANPASVAREVVAAVRRDQERERERLESVWVGRLHKTYADSVSAYDRAMSQEDGIDAAAKFLMVQARLCDTGLRADGVLSGGGESRTTIHVEQVVLLPQPERPTSRVIDVTETKDDRS